MIERAGPAQEKTNTIADVCLSAGLLVLRFACIVACLFHSLPETDRQLDGQRDRYRQIDREPEADRPIDRAMQVEGKGRSTDRQRDS